MIRRDVPADAGDHDRDERDALVSLSDIDEIELLILRRMRELTMGEHRSTTHGAGFDFLGLREWQAGDRPSSIDWAQSSLTNFSPTIVREFEQPSTATVVVIADRSASTRCGVNGVSIAHVVARAVAIFGMSSVFFQDPFGLITFDGQVSTLTAVRPRIGRPHVVQCLDAYQHGRGQELPQGGDVSERIGSFVRRAALIPFVSDFLFEDRDRIIGELARLNTSHDVFLTMIDSAFAFAVPRMSSGWIEVADVETGHARTISRRSLAAMAARAREWQDEAVRVARSAGLDVIRVSPGTVETDLALEQFVRERRLRKVA